MLIQIIKGTYGHKDGKVIRPKTPADGPFELAKDKAKDLIAAGIAIEVSEDTEKAEPVAEAETETDEAEVDETVETDADEDGDSEKAMAKEMTVKELKELAKEKGIEIPDNAKKAEIIDALF